MLSRLQYPKAVPSRYPVGAWSINHNAGKPLLGSIYCYQAVAMSGTLSWMPANLCRLTYDTRVEAVEDSYFLHATRGALQ
jgi:hypothetical protein